MCDNGGIGREGERKKRDNFPDGRLPPSPNLVRKLIKLSVSKVALSLSLSLSFPLSLFVCMAAVLSVCCLLHSLTILETALNMKLT